MHRRYYLYHERKGIEPVSWEDFYGICKGLALAVEPFRPELILGIARGGLYPATLLAHILRVDIFPVYLTRRQNDEPVTDAPTWRLRPPGEVAGRRVLIVDEICGSGATLETARAEVERMGAAAVRTAVCFAHTRGQDAPDYIGLISDALFLLPWGREIVEDGSFVPHPEYARALAMQGLDASTLQLGIDAQLPQKRR